MSENREVSSLGVSGDLAWVESDPSGTLQSLYIVRLDRPEEEADVLRWRPDLFVVDRRHTRRSPDIPSRRLTRVVMASGHEVAYSRFGWTRKPLMTELGDFAITECKGLWSVRRIRV